MSEKPNHHSDYSINLIKKYLCVFHNNIIYITLLLSKGGHQSLILTTISTEYWAQMNLRPHCQDKYHSNECETTLPWQVSLKWMWDHTAMTSITQMYVRPHYHHNQQVSLRKPESETQKFLSLLHVSLVSNSKDYKYKDGSSQLTAL